MSHCGRGATDRITAEAKSKSALRKATQEEREQIRAWIDEQMSPFEAQQEIAE